jgi:putative acetyltransferase
MRALYAIPIMKYRVRNITKSDIEGFAAVLGAVVKERKYLLTLEPPSIEDASDFVHTAIENNYAHYVAEVEGKIVGWADMTPRQKGSVRHIGKLGMGVATDYRGQGIGKELLENVIKHSWKIGLTRLELEVISSNHAAIALYEQSDAAEPHR